MNEPPPRLWGTLEANLVAFAAQLRAECGLGIGPGEEIDALRAVEKTGLESRERVRIALRLVFCAKHDDLAQFDRIFDRFFNAEPHGVVQERYAPRHTLPPAAEQRTRREATLRVVTSTRRESDAASEFRSGSALRSILASQDLHDLDTIGADASAIAGSGERTAIVVAAAQTLLAEADSLLRRLHLGRTRRWHSDVHGHRFDLRSTLRSSLRTGGEPFVVRRLGHPHRNPRIVVAIDGSRSMEGQREGMLRFAWALAQRSRRTAVFAFSTGLHDLTGELREKPIDGLLEIGDLDDAWGGGTRIGASLAAMVREHGHRILGRDTVLLIFSDGLDVGEPPILRSAMRELRRRTAAVIWLNPLLGTPNYEPSARGIRAAMPFVTCFLPAHDAAALGETIASWRPFFKR